jgi:hypothetical protein
VPSLSTLFSSPALDTKIIKNVISYDRPALRPELSDQLPDCIVLGRRPDASAKQRDLSEYKRSNKVNQSLIKPLPIGRFLFHIHNAHLENYPILCNAMQSHHPMCLSIERKAKGAKTRKSICTDICERSCSETPSRSPLEITFSSLATFAILLSREIRTHERSTPSASASRRCRWRRWRRWPGSAEAQRSRAFSFFTFVDQEIEQKKIENRGRVTFDKLAAASLKRCQISYARRGFSLGSLCENVSQRILPRIFFRFYFARSSSFSTRFASKNTHFIYCLFIRKCL